MVREAVDGRTFALEDGRLVRLAGIEIARVETPDGAAAAKLRLDELLRRGAVQLRRLGGEADRYGRVLALVDLPAGGGKSVQHALVAEGHAQVGARLTDRACAGELLLLERKARENRLGVWGEAYYLLKRAEEPATVLAGSGRFALVEGKVESVRESGSIIYVNFGRRWSDDFTVTIAKRDKGSFAAAGLTAKTLERRRIRVRGWIEERGGPWIEAVHPGQIELLERQ